MKCKICNCLKTNLIFKSDGGLPILSNVVFINKIKAKNIASTKMEIYHCSNCDFVFDVSKKNILFDKNYDNSQQYSQIYINYMEQICNDIKNIPVNNNKIVEIGCGNGFLVNMLNNLGMDAYGFDTSYNGNNHKIKNRYYNEKDEDIKPGLFVLRHMLDYLENPLEFLHQIAKINNYNSTFYIEIPSYDYIEKYNFWIDFNAERFSYFSKEFFKNIFNNFTIKETFNDQYLIVIARMNELKEVSFNNYIRRNYLMESFNNTKTFINTLNNVALWGASGRGVTFANLIDSNQIKIQYLIDINKNKINKYIGGTGHKIISIDEIKNSNILNIIIMNSIYESEIKKILKEKELDIKTYTIDVILKKEINYET